MQEQPINISTDTENAPETGEYSPTEGQKEPEQERIRRENRARLRAALAVLIDKWTYKP